jgi:outer membrane protein assembly factor BamB
MKRRLLKIGGALLALAVVVAGAGYAAYKLKLFAGVDTQRGDVAATNEATAPPPQAPPPPKPSWPYFRYDERRLGSNPHATARPPFRVRWKTRLPPHGYLEAPGVLEDGVLVVGSYGKRFGSDLTAMDADTGRVRWRRHYPHGANYAGSAGIHNGVVYATSHDGHMRAHSLRTGATLWQMRIAASESPPIVKGNLLYFGDGPPGGNGKFRAVDLRTRRVVWSFEASGTISSGATLTSSTLYFSSYGGTVYALNRFNGRLRWKSSVSGARGQSVPFYSTPAVADGKVVVGGLDGGVYALNARTGEQVWSHTASNYVYPSAAVWQGRVFIGDFSGNFYALSLTSGRELWRYSMGPIIGSASVVRGVVYISSLRPAKSYGLSAVDGKVLWTFPDGQFSPIIADQDRAWLMGKEAIYGLVMPRARAARPAKPQPKPIRGSGTVNVLA